jgi:hypothetical protein
MKGVGLGMDDILGFVLLLMALVIVCRFGA